MPSPIRTITIDANALIRSEKNKILRERAITDLLEGNSFALANLNSPYDIHCTIADNKFHMQVSGSGGEPERLAFPLSPLRQVIKDYHIICESYYETVKSADPRRTEAIDMGRRGVHNEGAEIIEALLGEKVALDFETLRKLFALIYALQVK